MHGHHFTHKSFKSGADVIKLFGGPWFTDLCTKPECLLDLAGKASEGQTLWLIMKTLKLQTKKVL